MASSKPQPIFRHDYLPPDFLIDRVSLRFELGSEKTIVDSKISIRRNPASENHIAPLKLNGEALQLHHIRIDETLLAPDRYQVSDRFLMIPEVPEQFLFEARVQINPKSNTCLFGLFQSNDIFCTQCEAEGFRKITYYLDRPDVMAQFQTTIVADPKNYPILLSNGNRTTDRVLDDGRLEVVWEDPFPKPSYLFALVAGRLSCHKGSFTTKSGRPIDLEIWVEESNLDKCQHALESLQKAMRWDEEVYGREYDLDTYMIVAVNDFNMGAMENKGLNVFNTKYVLAKPETATDEDYENIEAVIAHEYFHNWTGNRVTCRDWFQLTLKEGLTVFRDSQFSADMTSQAVKRIHDVIMLRTTQFAEDAGPMAHPIRPESYIEMNNFYTLTVYEKGAEVVRMYHTLFGKSGFRKGMDLYFERYDGQAVTCDDFRTTMADANHADLDLFERWYSDAGTPTLHAKSVYDEQKKTLRIDLEQTGPNLSGGSEYRPRHIPISIGLLDSKGQEIALHQTPESGFDSTTSNTYSQIIELKQTRGSVTFHNVTTRPIVSFLRDFSAPVIVHFERSRGELAFLMSHDIDSFSRWDAGQELAEQVLFDMISDLQSGQETVVDPIFVEAFAKVLQDPKLDLSLKQLALTVPDERQIAQKMTTIDVDAIHRAREKLIRHLAQTFEHEFVSIYSKNTSKQYQKDALSIAQRRIKSVALGYLSKLESNQYIELAYQQFEQADNMSDAHTALLCLSNIDCEFRERAFEQFYQKWRKDDLVIDKWFSLQARSSLPNTVEQVEHLTRHSDFRRSNPNRFRALIGSFGNQNPNGFHRSDGKGYLLLADEVLAIEQSNPQTAARVVSAFNQWRRYDSCRQALMSKQIERIYNKANLSRDVYEIVSRALANRSARSKSVSAEA